MAVHWHSFYLYFNREMDTFLGQWLAPGLGELYGSGRLKRAFFIRYSEGGYHLRLRLDSQMGNDGLMSWLADLANHFDHHEAGAIATIKAVAYDRDEAYFGQTTNTLYAELMNVASSDFILSLLQGTAIRTHSQRLIIAMVALAWWLEQTTTHAPTRQRLIANSKAFAERVLADIEPDRMKQTWAITPAIQRSFLDSKALLFPQFASNQGLAKAARTSRRFLLQQGSDPAVFNHSMHLLCNKLGLSIGDERFIFSVLEDYR